MPSSLFEAAIELAVMVNERSAAKYETAPNDLVRDACFVLSHDAICVHRAIGALAQGGWSSPGGALLRTLMDLNVSAVAIAHSANPRMAAFKYLYTGFRRHSRDQAFPAAARRELFEQIRSRIRQLPGELRSDALEVVKDRDRPYWFAPEWNSPAEVLDAFGQADLKWTYMQASAAAHGSFLGMRLFRDNPDSLDINPRPVGRRAVALEVTSSRWLIELVRVRDAMEGLGLAAGISVFVERLVEAGNELARSGHKTPTTR